jgi:hypothetical protein
MAKISMVFPLSSARDDLLFDIIITPGALKIVSNSLFWANFVKKIRGAICAPDKMMAALFYAAAFFFSRTSITAMTNRKRFVPAPYKNPGRRPRPGKSYVSS